VGAEPPAPDVPADPESRDKPGPDDGSSPDAAQQPEAPAAAPLEEQPARAATGTEPPSANPAEPAAAREPPEFVYQHDFDGMLDTITSTIEPTSWDEVGGPGSITYFPYTLDFVVSATPAVQWEIVRLFRRLRSVPPVVDDHPDMRPARLPPPDDPARLNFHSLIEAITRTVQPHTWDEVGGPGSIAPDLPRAALIVAQTQSVHAEVWELLTLLRRSRYSQLRPDRPWQNAPLRPGIPLIDPWNLAPVSTELTDAKLPPPQPEELAALRACKFPERGRWVWQKRDAEGRPLERVEITRDGQRLEVRLPEATVRIAGGEVAVAWNDLGLVELGGWAEAVRQMLDARLPWLPHRSGPGLARSFMVRPDPVAAAASVRLRLVPPGCDPDGDTYLLAEFSSDDGRVLAIKSRAAGEFGGNWRVTEDRTAVVETDADGKRLARWDRVEHDAAPPPLRPLDEFGGMVRFDRRGDEPAVDPELFHAVEAIKRRDWAAASRGLARLAARFPRNALVALLRAWCYDNDATLGPREERLAELTDAAEGARPAFFRWLREGHLRWLSPAERYALLRRQSESLRTPADHDALAEAAVAAGNTHEALAHVEAAIRSGPAKQPERFRRERRRVELLVELGRADDVVAAAEQWSSRGDAKAAELVAMAVLVARAERPETADALLRRALSSGQLSSDERPAAIMRRADLQEGLKRWKLIVEAASLLPEDSSARRAWVEALLAELSHPAHAEAAAGLATATDDPSLQVELRVRQAELCSDARQSGQVVWELFKAGRLPPDRLSWAAGLWNQAGTYARTIEACEARLRAGRILKWSLSPHLQEAYRELDRPLDARRAATEDPEVPPARALSSGSGGMGFF